MLRRFAAASASAARPATNGWNGPAMGRPTVAGRATGAVDRHPRPPARRTGWRKPFWRSAGRIRPGAAAKFGRAIDIGSGEPARPRRGKIAVVRRHQAQRARGDPEDLAIGDAVVVAWDRVDDELTLPIWEVAR